MCVDWSERVQQKCKLFRVFAALTEQGVLGFPLREVHLEPYLGSAD